ncbi:nucleotidyltransferase [Brevundimonas sp. MYb46]|nr:nucleotidyltransferase [Brevundimonas sp. MYb31]PRA30957.1 nucleotidyltransferase [Brevundimonas sp. MYb27]PRB17074.1 nucleotidyltransferase [Brevundimonas sp. MYb52]PRB34754.1 nucleotidyltransferase [Brevundimonas sp. MYb46]PRB54795.1 nucleotidyltransferase [Brevundimonas sp. MYb33]
MKTSLDHLPLGKRRELEHVLGVIKDEFGKAIANRRAEGVKDGQILKVILYGSYARGDWVEDPVGRYFSDFDLLVVVSDEKLTDVLEFWEGAEKRLRRDLASGANLRTPADLIIHSLDDVNDQLAQGRYFFADIVRDGVVLFEEPDHPFVDPQPLPSEAALNEAEKYYRDRMETAGEFFDDAQSNYERGRFKKGAFEAHQAAEHLYNAILLVATLYTPKSHNLVRLRNAAEPIDARLSEVWPTETKFQKRCFELLRAAYVKARYSEHYRVTAEELTWMLERLSVLQNVVETICRERLNELIAASKG